MNNLPKENDKPHIHKNVEYDLYLVHMNTSKPSSQWTALMRERYKQAIEFAIYLNDKKKAA